MAGLAPFDLGNTLGTIEQIKGARLGNSLRQQQLSQNALAGGGVDIGMVNPRDFTAQSIDRFKQTGDFNVLERYSPPKSAIKVDRGDAWDFYNPITNELINSVPKNLPPEKQIPYIEESARTKAQASADVDLDMGPKITEATEQKKADVRTKNEADIAKNTALGKAAAVKANKLFEAVDKISTNIQNLGSAVQALKSGAQTGPVAQFLPTIRSSTRELMNIQSRLGLDIVGAVTFGALSKGELDLALSTALPVGLEEPELMAWLEEKLESQRKLMDYFSEAGQFLSQPGNTESMWNELITSGNKADPRSSEPAGISTEQGGETIEERAARLLDL
jgi:hypothetical protein